MSSPRGSSGSKRPLINFMGKDEWPMMLCPPVGVPIEPPRIPLHNRTMITIDDDIMNALDDDVLCCRICLCRLTAPIVTECLHRFCRECISRHFRHYDEKKSIHRCPLCNVEIRSVRSVKSDTKMEGLLSVIESVNNNSVKEKKDDDITTKTIIEDAAKLHAQRSSDIVQRSRKQNRVVRNYTEEHMTDSSSIPIKRSKRGRPHYEAQENILHHAIPQQKLQHHHQQQQQQHRVQQLQHQHQRIPQHQQFRVVDVDKNKIQQLNKNSLLQIKLYKDKTALASNTTASLRERGDLILAIEGIYVKIKKHPMETKLGTLSVQHLWARADMTTLCLKTFLLLQGEITGKNQSNINSGSGIVLEIGVPNKLHQKQNQASQNSEQLRLFTLNKDSTTLLQIKGWIHRKLDLIQEVNSDELQVFYRSATF